MGLLVALLALAWAVRDKLYEMAIERGISFAESELSLVHGVQSEIDKLRRTTDRIHALLADADERRYIEDDSVRLWLRHLNDVAFDADDVLDDFQTDLNVSELRRNPPSHNNRKRPWYHLLTVTDPILLKRRRIAGKISDIRDSLDAIHKDREQLRLRGGDARRRIRSRDDPALPMAGAFQDVMRVRGREGDVDRIVEQLTGDDGLNAVAVVPVVGMGGIGKTTVAALVFDDMRIRAHFELRIWVCLSKDSDETAATREIIEAIAKKKSEDLSLDILQHRLVDLVRRKRFLLVLDNVWSELPRFWETVRQPLLGGRGGSKVLVTTRSEKAANAMNRGPQVRLQGLEFSFCLELFRERAFAGRQSENDELERIGEKIVDKCQGSPLAAKSLGAILYNVTDEDAWSSVLDEMWVLEEEEFNVLRTLKVSFDHLPLHLKRCLGYCSIFPSSYEFDKDELVKLWMAEGFIKPKGKRRLETIGEKYFDDLLWRSFFQISHSCGQLEQKYTMPSLINELAQSVSVYECLRIEHNAHNTGSSNPRYASIFCRNLDSQVIDELCGYESLRTLIFHGEHGLPLTQVLPKLFASFRCLRTLDLRNSKVEELPSSIGNLKHLRCLMLYNTHIRKLPESVSSLYNLQTLDLGECYGLQELPSGTGDLVNLRHLDLHVDWDRATDLVSMPPRIGGLTSLQTLSRFTITSQHGCGIAELKDLNLRGELCISKLENVVSVRDAEDANLKGKQYIEALMLRWSPRYSMQNIGVNEEDVIGKLCPNKRLKKLQIEYYSGMNFPNWIGDPSFANLESLILSRCKRCRSLPPLERLPKLRKLHMEGMLELQSMPNLPPSLKELEIRNCRRLTSFPVLDSLCNLVIVGGNEEIIRWIAGIKSLISLTISSVQGLKNLPNSFFQHLNSLKKLKIEQCNKLESVTMREGFESLSSLECLEVSSCPELASLPRGMHALSALCSLEIRDVPKLTSMPVEGLPAGLQNLVITGCPLLQKHCSRDGGADWPKIQDIPNLSVA